MPAAPDKVWAEERVARLRELLLDRDLSGQGIARALSAEFHIQITRSAVIAKVWRMKLQLPRRGVAPRPPPRPRSHRKKPFQPPGADRPIERVVCVPIPVTHCTLFELDRTRCHWPIGDPRQAGFMFCGAPVSAGDYCTQHHAIAFDFGKGSTGSLRWRMRHGQWK